jgi:putative Mg2+ transporter-C (MgtC) family protein
MAAAWDTIWRTVVGEFSDLGQLEQVTQVVVRLLVAAALGGVLGLERERQGKPAGIRTYMLVSATSALIVVVSVQAGLEKDALSRVLQGLLAGASSQIRIGGQGGGVRRAQRHAVFF